MRIVAFCALHYGAPYLASSIRSVIDAVDNYIVVYTPYPSHGFTTTMQCPDKRDDLLEIASREAGSKLVWYEHPTPFRNEAEHRGAVFGLVPNAELVLVTDSDDTWMPAELDSFLRIAHDGDARNYLASAVHLWRSFYRAVIDDFAAPVRAIKMSGSGTRATGARFTHGGYAQPTEYIKYKIAVFGHAREVRSGWFDEKWCTNAQKDVHPCNGEGFWNPVTIVPWEYLPDWMRVHPYASEEFIP